MTAHQQNNLQAPLGLAAVAGALADWEDLEDTVQEIYAARRGSRDRPAPDLKSSSRRP